MAKGFAKGLVTGVAGTVAAVAGAVYAIKKKVIEPEEQKAAFIEDFFYSFILNENKRAN